MLHLLLGVVERKRSAHHALDTASGHERLGAMMPCAHGNSEFVEQQAHIIVMDIPHQKLHDAAFVSGIAKDAHPRDFVEQASSHIAEILLVSLDFADIDALYI